MKILRWLRTKLTKRKIVTEAVIAPRRGALREFVYLDEVSLRSLLSSQTGEMTESKSQQSIDNMETELTGKAAIETPLVAKTEINSRFQTSNSSTLQTSRKATVQSWFRELLDIDNLRLIQPAKAIPNFKDTQELLNFEDKSVVINSSQLRRGELIEIRVRLAADPVFHLGTMVSEMSAIAEDFPNTFKENGSLASIKDAQMTNKILQKLLAGLIPIRAESIDYVVIYVNNSEYIVHINSISSLKLPHRPLFIVGVTEHLAYWKDIRRVLFSDAEFSVLCRISRNNLQISWTPVKLAELFSDFTPNLVEQINTASLAPFNGRQQEKEEDVNERRLIHALQLYKTSWLLESGKTITAEEEAQIENVMVSVKSRATTATGQRSAFKAISIYLTNLVHATIDSSKDAIFRDEARIVSGLPLIPSLASKEANSPSHQLINPSENKPRLLDAEIIAIYW